MNEQAQRIARFLEDIGASEIEFIHPRHGHPRLYFTYDGQRRYKAVSGSPSSPYGWRMAVRDIKRMLGIQKREMAPSMRPCNSTRQTRRRMTAIPEFTPLPDYREVLAEMFGRGT